jgi:hypothetical protein
VLLDPRYVKDVVAGLLLAACVMAPYVAIQYTVLRHRNMGYEHWLAKLCPDNMKSALRFRSHMYTFWDNVILGNSLNSRLWKERFSERASAARWNDVQQNWTKELCRVLAGLLFYLYLANVFLPKIMGEGERNALEIGVVFLQIAKAGFRVIEFSYRIVDILIYVSEIVRLDRVLGLTSEDFCHSYVEFLSKRIQFDKIAFTLNQGKEFKLKDMDDVYKLVGRRKEAKMVQRSGRFVIRGPNGAGKSVLLVLVLDYVQNVLKEDAHMIPAQNRLVYRTPTDSLSVGSGMMAKMKEFCEFAAAQKSGGWVYLLDEVDANLSTANRNLLNQMLDELAAENLVLQVKHSANSDE